MPEAVRILFTIPISLPPAPAVRAEHQLSARQNKFAPAVCVSRKGGRLDKEVEAMGIPFLEANFTVPARPISLCALRRECCACIPALSLDNVAFLSLCGRLH